MALDLLAKRLLNSGDDDLHSPCASASSKTFGTEAGTSRRGFLYGSRGLGLIYGALDLGKRLDWLNSGVIWDYYLTAAFLLGVTIIRRWRSPNPMVNPIFLVNRNTMILAATLFSFRFVMQAIAFLLPACRAGRYATISAASDRQRVALANPPLIITGLVARD